MEASNTYSQCLTYICFRRHWLPCSHGFHSKYGSKKPCQKSWEFHPQSSCDLGVAPTPCSEIIVLCFISNTIFDCVLFLFGFPQAPKLLVLGKQFLSKLNNAYFVLWSGRKYNRTLLALWNQRKGMGLGSYGRPGGTFG